MIVSVKDGSKLFGITVMCACAVFVNTFFLNFYLDASSVREEVPRDLLALYEAQLFTAKFVCLISGCCLLLVSVVLLLFYVGLYVESHAKQLGILKAMGYPNAKIALSFTVFGLSVLIGTAIGFAGGFAMMPAVYETMGDGFSISIGFHAELLFLLVVLPAAVFAALAYFFALFKLRRSALSLLKNNKTERAKKSGKDRAEKDRPFLKVLGRETLKSRKPLVFFVGFSCFCFSAMTQMSVSMDEYASKTMGAVIFLIGIVLSVTALLLSLTSLVSSNGKTAALMGAYGYTPRECRRAVFALFRIPAGIGFALGTVYEYFLMRIMIGVVFGGVGYEVPAYQFDVAAFFITFAVFAVLYELTVLLFARRLNKVSLRSTMAE